MYPAIRTRHIGVMGSVRADTGSTPGVRYGTRMAMLVENTLNNIGCDYLK